MEAYQHLRIEREQPVNKRRSRKPLIIPAPNDIAAHGRKLYESFHTAQETIEEEVGELEDRCPFKLQLGSLSADNIEAILGVELISHEEI